jgi:hypothetical protein
MKTAAIAFALGFMSLLAAPCNVLADEGAIFLTLDISREYDVTGYDIFYLEGPGEYEFFPVQGKLSLEIISSMGGVLFQTGTTPTFFVLSDPPVDTEGDTVIMTLPYDSRAEYIRLYNNGTEIFSLRVREALCTPDGSCAGFENFYSCPSDCSVFSEDGVCASMSFDGGCDPDCPPNLDIDCSCPNGVCDEWEGSVYCPQDCGYPGGGTSWDYIPVMAVAIVILVAVTLFLIWKDRKSELGREAVYRP